MTPPPTPPVATPEELPAGFSFAGVHAGVKRSRRDLGLIVCPDGAVVAGCFTKNPVRAACVDRDRELVPADGVKAVVVNSGNANAMTGAAGVVANRRMATAVAEILGVDPDSVLTSSTGVIGAPLPIESIERAMPQLVEALTDGPEDFAKAILTTDTVTKLTTHVVSVPGESEPVRIVGVAKGSGMIHPNMATTLGFVCTDAAISPATLQRLLSNAIETTFNAISVDGDTSTNDAVLVLASGKRGAVLEAPDAVAAFDAGLTEVLRELAIMVASDGEGATRLLEVEVSGAADRTQAAAIARAICRGNLFKCSVFAGEVGGWGRLAAAAGQAACENGIAIEADKLTIRAQDMALVNGGIGTEADLGELARRLREPRVRWHLDLGAGEAAFVAYGCDLSYDYVRINADESLQLEVRADGRVGRNLSLGAYSPTLKHQLLVDGLGYVRRFTGLRVMIHLGGAVTRKPELLASFARDLELILDAGMRPLVVVDAESTGEELDALMKEGAYRLAEVAPVPADIARRLDRGHACKLIQRRREPGDLVDLAIRLGVTKLLALADDQGLHDRGGLVSVLSPEQALSGLDRGRFTTVADENLALARHAAQQGLPALHLIDGRIPHALVAELFTDEGVGTLITRVAT